MVRGPGVCLKKPTHVTKQPNNFLAKQSSCLDHRPVHDLAGKKLKLDQGDPLRAKGALPLKFYQADTCDY